MAHLLSVVSPIEGQLIPLETVPDPVFSALMMGPGIAIDPHLSASVQQVLAPISGVVAKVYPHAFIIQATQEPEKAVLVHLGLDTVKLEGEGFAVEIKDGATVKAGDHISTWEPARVKELGYNPITMVIAVQAGADDVELRIRDSQRIATGEHLFSWR